MNRQRNPKRRTRWDTQDDDWKPYNDEVIIEPLIKKK